VRHREHDEGRDASTDRKVDKEAGQVTNGDRRKSLHREERDSRGKHREHDEGRDASRDRKSDREDTRGTAKDKKYDRDDGKDHSRERRAGKDDKSGASKETLPSRDDDRHGRPNRDDWKSASSREQRLDRGDRRDSTGEKPTDHEESNGGSGRSSRRGRSVSPEEHRHRGRHESHPSPRVSRSAARTEVLVISYPSL
jgi:smad nuclear-interacting protein 1